MCGRFVLCLSHFKYAEDDFEVPPPRYNIAPTQAISVIYRAETGKVKLSQMRWGLIPRWWKEARMPTATFNARAETVAEKPAFREAFRKRRCLIPASGFYEWQKSGAKKVPYYFSSKNSTGFAFGGIWEEWQQADGNMVCSCSIIVAAANGLVEPIHDRMAVVIAPEDYPLWMDSSEKLERIKALLVPYDENKMQGWEVSSEVNKVVRDDSELIRPVRPGRCP